METPYSKQNIYSTVNKLLVRDKTLNTPVDTIRFIFQAMQFICNENVRLKLMLPVSCCAIIIVI